MKNRTKEQTKRKSVFSALLSLFTKKESIEEYSRKFSQRTKILILEQHLARFFADHDKISNEVNLFPLTRAREEIQRIIKNNTLDYYFEWFLLQQEYLRNLVELQKRYNDKHNFKKVQA